MNDVEDPHPYLIQVAWTSTCLLLVSSSLLSSRPVLINGAFILVVLGAFVVYSYLIYLNPLHLLFHFYELLVLPSYISHSTRWNLLLFWLLNLAASLLFVIVVSHLGRSGTVHRKFFHLTLSLVFVSGILLDGPLLCLSSALLLSIFTILEIFRYYAVPPWGETLNKYLMVFRDHQDGDLLLTPLFLLAGVNLPLLLCPPSSPPPLSLMAGVASVGVGDAVAAIVGSKWGRRNWPRRRKTMEGTAAMFVSVASTLLFLRLFTADPHFSLIGIVVTSAVLSFVEAFLANFDNILLPLIGYGLIRSMS